MYFLYLFILASLALANDPAIFNPRAVATQNLAIDPTEIPVSSCSSGWTRCPGGWNGGFVCVDKREGDVCCPQGCKLLSEDTESVHSFDAPDGCPVGYFCLIEGKCCPDGIDPQTCAKQKGVTLPDDFGTSHSTGNPVPEATPTVDTSLSADTSTLEATPSVETSPSTDIPVPEPTPSVATPPYIISSNTSTPVETATGTGALPGPTSVTPFTGTGSIDSARVYGAMAAVIGASLLRAMV